MTQFSSPVHYFEYDLIWLSNIIFVCPSVVLSLTYLSSEYFSFHIKFYLFVHPVNVVIYEIVKVY